MQASAATLMTTVQQIDPVYVDLTQSSVEGLQLRRDIASGQLKLNGPDQAKVTLLLEDGTQYREPGTLQFSDITVDPGTGSVTVRAIFPNPRFVLLPGMFVRARIEEGVNENAFLVPQVGVTHDPRGQATALVVGADNKVVVRTAASSEGPAAISGSSKAASKTAIASSSPAFRRCNPARWCRRSSRRRQSLLQRPPGIDHDGGSRRRRSPAAASGHACLAGEIGEESRHGQVLHRPPDLRDRHRDPDDARGRLVDLLDADRAVSDDRAAVDPDHRDLPRRLCGDSRKHRRAGDRAADERARSPDLHLVQFGRLRHGDHDADFRGRNQSRHRAGAGAEQAAARHSACSPRRFSRQASGSPSRATATCSSSASCPPTTACRATTSPTTSSRTCRTP